MLMSSTEIIMYPKETILVDSVIWNPPSTPCSSPPQSPNSGGRDFNILVDLSTSLGKVKLFFDFALLAQW